MDPAAEFRSGPKKLVIPFRMELESPLAIADSERPSAWAMDDVTEAGEATETGTFDDADA